MGFRELALEDTPYSWSTDETRGRRLMTVSTGRLDDSWASIRRTTLSVACVTVASAALEHRDIARKLIISMAGMMSRMCDYWAEQVGGVTQGTIELSQAREESDETDRIGQELAEHADLFLGAIMVSLLTELPKAWSIHLRLAKEVATSFGSLVEGRDSEWVARQVAEEQRRLVSALLADTDEAMQDGSAGLISAMKWVEASKAVFEASSDLGPRVALAAVVTALGFPNAEG